MAFFKQQQPVTSERQLLAGRYNSARVNLILVVALTAINIIMVAAGIDSYFVFSANVPYLLTLLGAFYCGKLPEEFYEGGMDAYEFLDPAVYTVLLVISILIVAAYLAFFFLSAKGRVGWLIAAEVFFVIDTLAMFGYFGFDVSILMDIILHIYVVVTFAMGISAAFKLRKMPPEPAEPIVVEGTEVVEGAPVADEVDAPKAEGSEFDYFTEPVENTDKTDDTTDAE